MVGDQSPRLVLLEAARILRDRADVSAYGYRCVVNPHDFTPDEECSTSEDRERHRLACEAWDRGEHEPPEPTWTFHPTETEARAHANACLGKGASSASVHPHYDPQTGEPDGFAVHAHVGGWGMGTNALHDEEMIAAAKRCEELAATMPDEDDDGPF